MKTIAITIDESTIKHIDQILAGENSPGTNRSQIIREAVARYLASLDREAEESREREIFHRQRTLLKKQAQALILDQAKS
jgi:metal-responsive CopG/Arc/MetJ family transcriptional regulator